MREIKLVISDVDGTLLTKDKTLRPPVRQAVERLGRDGIGFTAVSARPPKGERALIDQLGIALPFGSFNGGAIASPQLSILEEKRIGERTAEAAYRALKDSDLPVWIYTAEEWFAEAPSAPHAQEESDIVRFSPRPIIDVQPLLRAAIKIVGIARDEDEVERTAHDLGRRFSEECAVTTSKHCFVEVTSVAVNKATVVFYLCRSLSLSPAEIAVLGDGHNDAAMFRACGFSIAMASAPPQIKQLASCVTGSAEEDGFAAAVEKWLLKRSAS